MLRRLLDIALQLTSPSADDRKRVGQTASITYYPSRKRTPVRE